MKVQRKPLDNKAERAAGNPRDAVASGGNGLGEPLPRLDRRAGMPLHHQAFLLLRDQVLSGRFHAGEMLPSEDELTRIFGVSRITIRAALASLESRGFIERRQGIGTFVRERVPHTRLHLSISEQRAHVEELCRNTTMSLAEFAYEPAPVPVQEYFGCNPDAIFQRSVRIRSSVKPMFHVTTFVPETTGRKIGRESLLHQPVHVLLKEIGIRIGSGEQIVGAALADPVVAGRLEIDVGAPLLRMRHLYFDDHNHPVIYLEVLASPADYELHLSLQADNFIS